MKKFTLITIFLTIFSSFALIGCKNDNLSNNSTQNNSSDISYNSNTSIVNTTRLSTNSNNVKKHEEQISTFSTKISQDDSDRQNNIKICCDELNGAIVKSGETFSFCDTVGQATEEKGYKKAETFDNKGNTIMGYGGGKCQVSSTLYNAVLEAPNLTVVERYPHSKKVYYVPEGKDATVAYGSVDFKFKNDNDFNIKITAIDDGENVTITLFKV